MRILIIEDEPTIAENIQTYFKRSAISSDIELTAAGGMYQAKSETYDALIIDWMLPDGNGIQIVEEIRKEQRTPILMLTSKSQTDDVIAGLNAGADDYVKKPFSLAELLARVHALIRRKHGPSVSPVIRVGHVQIDTNTRSVYIKHAPIQLAPKEYLLLEYMALHPNIAIDRMQLLSHVWGEDIDPLSNTVDVHIRYLRSKLHDDKDHPMIQTIKGKGYMLCVPSLQDKNYQ